MAQVVRYTVMGRHHEAERGVSLLSELRRHGYEVPSLCYHEALSPYGACRLCLVEVKKGKRSKLTTSCNYPVQEGIEVTLDTDRVQRNRCLVLELLLAQAPKASRELLRLAERYGVRETRFSAKGEEACILCGLCAQACSQGIGANALTFSGRGHRKVMGPPFGEASRCIGCGACARICPTGAISMSDVGGVRTIWERTFQLERCQRCGGFTLSPEHLAALVERSGLDRSYFDLCDECRRRTIADRFKAVMR